MQTEAQIKAVLIPTWVWPQLWMTTLEAWKGMWGSLCGWEGWVGWKDSQTDPGFPDSAFENPRAARPAGCAPQTDTWAWTVGRRETVNRRARCCPVWDWPVLGAGRNERGEPADDCDWGPGDAGCAARRRDKGRRWRLPGGCCAAPGQRGSWGPRWWQVVSWCGCCWGPTYEELRKNAMFCHTLLYIWKPSKDSTSTFQGEHPHVHTWQFAVGNLQLL